MLALGHDVGQLGVVSDADLVLGGDAELVLLLLAQPSHVVLLGVQRLHLKQ